MTLIASKLLVPTKYEIDPPGLMAMMDQKACFVSLPNALSLQQAVGTFE